MSDVGFYWNKFPNSLGGYICPLHSFFYFSICYDLSHSHTFFYYWSFELSRGFSITFFSMPVSLAQWRGEIGAFYNNTLAFSNILTFYLVLSVLYGSIFCSLHLIKLLFLIIRLLFNRIMFFYFKKRRSNSPTIGVYLSTVSCLLIISNLPEHL